MEYHKDRFDDHSLLIFKNNALMAVLPANKQGRTLYSHQGLSYGGLVLSKETKTTDVIEGFREVLSYLNSQEIDMLELKKLPSIYNGAPSDEIDFIMYKLQASICRCDMTSAIHYDNPVQITSSNRKRSLKRGLQHGLRIEQDQNFEGFWNHILIPNLKRRHDTDPTHSLSEINYLTNLFPNNIKQFNVYDKDVIVGGVTIFETDQVAHAQYISANEQRQELGTLDVLFDHVINYYAKSKTYFDFGVSSMNKGNAVNEGLMQWKESFGARTVAHPVYEIETKHMDNLNAIML